jgi:hypothetical protein
LLIFSRFNKHALPSSARLLVSPGRQRTLGLDLPLIRWSRYPQDVWTLADAYQDVVVFGQKGSGKTSASARLFATRYLRAGFSGLVLVAQPEETELWRGYLKAAGQEDDGRFYSLDGDFRLNALTWEAQQARGAGFHATLRVNVSPRGVVTVASPCARELALDVSAGRATLIQADGQDLRSVTIQLTPKAQAERDAALLRINPNAAQP